MECPKTPLFDLTKTHGRDALAASIKRLTREGRSSGLVLVWHQDAQGATHVTLIFSPELAEH